MSAPRPGVPISAPMTVPRRPAASPSRIRDAAARRGRRGASRMRSSDFGPMPFTPRRRPARAAASRSSRVAMPERRVEVVRPSAARGRGPPAARAAMGGTSRRAAARGSAAGRCRPARRASRRWPGRRPAARAARRVGRPRPRSSARRRWRRRRVGRPAALKTSSPFSSTRSPISQKMAASSPLVRTGTSSPRAALGPVSEVGRCGARRRSGSGTRAVCRRRARPASRRALAPAAGSSAQPAATAATSTSSTTTRSRPRRLAA